ncbi:hypothetical protein A4A58_19445 [Tardiphaga robiniae]|uniref:Uncharacterized protein n=1 Tax=Tardiphaga robiniae TaxID=943830 RepID=A0A163X4H9_9BRAD|nr:hypothetical protein A4A58_19445 [Tardiphaga robiniae]
MTTRQFDCKLAFRGCKAEQAPQRLRRRLWMSVKIEQNDGAGFIGPNIDHLAYKPGDAFPEGSREP